jgi:hypothetical protein
MIHGISARVRCDHSLEVARGHLSEPGWPWAGPPGPRSTRLLRLRRCICDRVLLRVAEQGTIRLPSWRVIFEAVDGPASPALLDCVLTIESLQGGGTELVMRGQASAALVDDCGFVPDSLVRLAASACARAFLDHLGDAWATLSVPRRPFVLTDPEQPTS